MSLEILTAYERVLGPLSAGEDNDVWRKDINHPRLITVKGRSLSDLAERVTEGDPDILTKGASSHWLDLGLAARTTTAGKANLRRWAVEGKTSTLRANALSVLSVGAGTDPTDTRIVIRQLEQDDQVRTLCIASVVSRTLQLDWSTSRMITLDPSSAPHVRRLAKAMAHEAIDRRSVESRWVGSYMLRQLVPVLGA